MQMVVSKTKIPKTKTKDPLKDKDLKNEDPLENEDPCNNPIDAYSLEKTQQSKRKQRVCEAN